jgi:hypothetical protein
MVRESQIPLFLWIATAIVVHLASGGGATHAVAQIEETLQIGRFARSVRQHIRFNHQSLEIATVDDSASEEELEPDEQEAEKQPEPEQQPEQDNGELRPDDTEKKLAPNQDPVEPEEEELKPEEETEEEQDKQEEEGEEEVVEEEM